MGNQNDFGKMGDITKNERVIFPNYSYKGKIDISYSKYSKCIKIEKTDNIPKIFDKNFKFNCNVIIDESIFIYDDRYFRFIYNIH